MKKLFAIVALFTAMAFSNAKAQMLKTIVPTKDSCVNSDNTTITVTPTSNAALAFFVTAVKVSGTVAGSAKLQGSLDGTNWVDVGSAQNFTDVTTNTFIFEPTKLSWPRYRIYVATTGTCKIKPIRGYWVQRGS